MLDPPLVSNRQTWHYLDTRSGKLGNGGEAAGRAAHKNGSASHTGHMVS